ncbi:ribonuclease J, partial [Candidatus Woesebacteria bacterium]|nr:ribonuclease J [Candidatus Woesebacteria bacterium]
GAGTARKSELVQTESIYVDAYGVGDVGNVVLRDRKTLSSEGIVVAVMTVDESTKGIDARIVSRGFVFEKGEAELFAEGSRIAKQIITNKLASVGGKEASMEVPTYKKEVIRALEQYFKEQTGRMPLIVVEIIIT